ncbi:MAG: hypothetical protein KC492_12025 [Myxococcales bacterium]|nr:hypothetical protein [Myxococcales bacterium]
MNRIKLIMGTTAILSMVACGSDPDAGKSASGGAGGTSNGGTAGTTSGGTGGTAGSTSGGTGGTAGTAGGTGGSGLEFQTPSQIDAYLDGKLLTMTGADIPSSPNGIPENLNAGQATQCYHKTEMRPLGGTSGVKTSAGTPNDAPNQGDVGSCDRDTAAADLEFSSTSYVIENVSGGGDCFDFTVNYSGFAQEGRGSITADVLKLELYFADSATGIRCADGAVGSDSVMLNGNAFTGDAVQVYRITEDM